MKARSEAEQLAMEVQSIADIGIVNARHDTAALYAAANMLISLQKRIEELDRALEDAQERLAIMAEGQMDADGDDGSDFDPEKYEYRGEMRF